MASDVVKQLKQVPLFAELSRDELKAVAELVERAQYGAGSEICRQGQLGLTAYIVESGELRVLHVDPQGVQQKVARLGPGDYFGETSLLLGEPRDATVEAVQDVTLLYLNKYEFDRLLSQRPAMLKSLQMRSDVARKRFAKHYRWQEKDEVVVISTHRHDAILYRNLVFPVFVLAMVLVSSAVWYQRSQSTLPLIVGGLLSLMPILFIGYLVWDHQDDIYIVTNKRVVLREQVPLGRQTRVEAPLRTVQDIQESQEGLWAQVWNYGDLIIETAGERAHVAFRAVPDPEGVRDAIFEQIRRVQAGVRAEERAAIRDALERHFGIQAEGEEAAGPPSAPKKARSRLVLPRWVTLPFRGLGYLLPSLWQEQGDTITWRKHWIALPKFIALPSLLILVTTTIAVFLVWQIPASLGGVLVSYVVVSIFLFPWWLWQFDDWRNDIYQVTATRIIDVERLPFYLREDRREASLGVIQNISLEIPGFLGRLLNYGSVAIETAGAGPFTFDYVKDPRRVQAEIFRRVEAFQRRQRLEAAERHRNELLDWFSVYDQVRSDTLHPPSASPTIQASSMP